MHLSLSQLVRLHRPPSAPLDPEDILDSALGVFSDLQNHHGDGPATAVLYENARHSVLRLQTADVDGEEQRRKFAHYLWNAGVLMGELVGGRAETGWGREGDGDGKAEWWVRPEEEEQWSVAGEMVLELGAGLSTVWLCRGREG